MNNESKDDKIVKRVTNIDNENAIESPVDNIYFCGGSTFTDSVNKDKAGCSNVKQGIDVDNENASETPFDKTQVCGGGTFPDSVNKDTAGCSKVKHGINIDNENESETPFENTQVCGGSTFSDSVNKDKSVASRCVDADMAATNFSLASGTAPVATNVQVCDYFSPTSSSYHDPGRLSRYNVAAVAGPSVSPKCDADYYCSLKAIGISRRRKFSASLENSPIVENSEVENTAAGLDQYSNNQQLITIRLDPLVDSPEDVKSAVGNRYLTANSTSPDVSSACLTPVEKQHLELENMPSYTSALPSPEVATIVIQSSVKLEEALKQIVEEQSMKHTNYQQGTSGIPELESLDSPSLDHTKDDGTLKNIDVKSSCPDTADLHVRHSILKIHNEEEELEHDKITQKESEITSPKLTEQFLSTGQRKKSVHFADSHGLDLVAVRIVENTNSPPNVPQSVLDALWLNVQGEQKEAPMTSLYPCFEQPGADFNFHKKVFQQQICLENVLVSEMTVNGYIRVAKTLRFPSVVVRYTCDNWSTTNEIYATHIFATPDDRTERYSFIIDALPHMEPGSFLELVLVMTSDNIEYFDNNDGQNYRLECIHKLTSSSSVLW